MSHYIRVKSHNRLKRKDSIGDDVRLITVQCYLSGKYSGTAKEYCDDCNISVPTLYNWIKKFRSGELDHAYVNREYGIY